MNQLRFIDTNILLYSISTDPAEARKRDLARALLEHDDLGLSIQVLQEFYVQATRATRSGAVSHDIAVALIRTWLRFVVQETTLSVMLGALDIRAAHRLSYWDAAIVAAARALGCREVLTEDLTHGREIEGLLINNPFRS